METRAFIRHFITWLLKEVCQHESENYKKEYDVGYKKQ
jgi:hypothetical protein